VYYGLRVPHYEQYGVRPLSAVQVVRRVVGETAAGEAGALASNPAKV
jgi:hypothetical protein